jgi:hypothetical protein
MNVTIAAFAVWVFWHDPERALIFKIYLLARFVTALFDLVVELR